MGDDATRMLNWSVDTPIADSGTASVRKAVPWRARRSAWNLVVPPRRDGESAQLTDTPARA